MITHPCVWHYYALEHAVSNISAGVPNLHLTKSSFNLKSVN